MVDHLRAELVGGQVHAVVVIVIVLFFLLGELVAHGESHLQARNEQLVLCQRLGLAARDKANERRVSWPHQTTTWVAAVKGVGE